ncbi:hypothetical protein ACHAWT_005438 [Skeletonema menzelii]|mmetsp:Transcript_5836/g.9813  ORF Transcript_5836/g.9813 Transcript_5836/m.9813 type:complete len:456 (-) Transcript_5836:136-1503(-)|eukprot:scaffold5084_cov145-Skeletonema_menzelii.AAC.14
MSSRYEDVVIPAGDLGVTIKMGANGMCTVVEKTVEDYPLNVLDVIVSLNGIKLAEVQDGEEAWAKLFDTFNAAPMTLVVSRGGGLEETPAAPPAAASSPSKAPALPPIDPNLTPDFEVCTTVKKRDKDKALLCKAAGCEKLLQSSHGGFCRGHYKRYLISTGQCDSWDCKCGEKISSASIRCGKCHRWRYGQKPGSRKTYVPEDAAVQISDVVLRNERGRPLCKVINCGKTEQAHNDGFCRTHFNLFVIDDNEHGGIDGMKDPWMCVCGKQWPQMQKRCGNTKCQKWRGGKREVWSHTAKKSKKLVEENDGESWTCDHCQNVVTAKKTRCGKCHRWRGGKRQGGWKLGANATSTEDNIDRSTDWTCCDQPLPASQTRCGKCNKWRGGKRRPAKPGPEGGTKKLKVDGEDGMMEPVAVVGVNEPHVPLLPDAGMQEAVNEVVVDVAAAEEELMTSV